MQDAILKPWPWYVCGPLIGITVPIMLLWAGKALGISSSFQYLCSLAFNRSKITEEDPTRMQGKWKTLFSMGVLLGGFTAAHILSKSPIAIFPAGYHSLVGAVKLLGGGFLVGFGSRYAEGCTSGHAIFGLSSLQLASLVAVIGFFAGGLAAAGIASFFG